MIARMYNKALGRWFDTDDHQHEAYAHLMANPRALLFLEMSLSKTVTALSYVYDMLYTEAAFTRVLVVAPDKVARLTWPEQVSEWAHLDGMRLVAISGDEVKRDKALAADAEVFTIGMANVSWLERKYWDKRKKRWKGTAPFDCIIVDEISEFKTRDSGRSKSLMRFITHAPYVIGMTGTAGDLIDLWQLVKLVDGGERLGPKFGEYVDKYFRMRGNGMIVYEYIPRQGVQRVILHKVRDIILTKRLADTNIVMPSVEYIDMALRMDAFDREQYDEMEREMVLELPEGDVSAKTSADLSIKLQQLASGAIYDEDRNVIHCNTVKLDALEALVGKHPDSNFIVAYGFRHEIDRILERMPYARVMRTGAKSKEDKDEWNAGRIRMLLIHPASAGHGLNLQWGGNRLVWFSGTWRPDLWAQTNARLIRRGVEWTVYIYRLLVMGTRDKRQATRVDGKQSEAEFYMEEIKQLRLKHGK